MASPTAATGPLVNMKPTPGVAQTPGSVASMGNAPEGTLKATDKAPIKGT